MCTVDAVACARTSVFPEQFQEGLLPHRVRETCIILRQTDLIIGLTLAA